jgi:hypothetical protein
VLPAALSGITAAFVVANSRAICETMVFAIAVGAGPRNFTFGKDYFFGFIFNPFLSAETMTGHMVRIIGGDLSYDSIDYNSIFAIGLALFLMTLLRPAFSIVARTPRLSKAPCSSCHSVPIASMRWSGPGDIVRAHWSIRLAHAPPEVMTCGTCHAPDTPGTLRTLTGTAVAIDHAYQVCAQCHSGQAVDWAGGAHGKRVGGWAPPRVAFSCAECHDPHRPALEPRWPARGERPHSEVIQR